MCHRPSNCNLSNLSELCKSLATEIVSFAESLAPPAKDWRTTLAPPADSHAFGARACTSRLSRIES